MDNRGNERREVGERGTRGETRSQVSEMRQRAEQKADEVTTHARERARDEAAHQKHRASGQLDTISTALRETSRSLHGQEQDAVAGYVESAAQQVERLSDYLGSRTVGELVNEAQDFARREPALFLGGSFLLGLVGARFMRSSERHHDPDEGYDYERPHYRG